MHFFREDTLMPQSFAVHIGLLEDSSISFFFNLQVSEGCVAL